ncbi:MAG: tetratricopeptide repeat protein [Acidobacteria bacterium]|nr:tetratricopeptide repeat protein [Acidobacteriota bacterium]
MSATGGQRRSTKNPAAANPRTQEQASRRMAEAKFEEGQRDHESGNLAAAIEKYSAALEVIPDFNEALYQRGMAYLALKKNDLADADLARVIEAGKAVLASDSGAADPAVRGFFARAHSARAELRLAAGAQAEADAHFRWALELDPTLLRARLLWAANLMERGAHEQAEKLLLDAGNAGTLSPDLLTMLGHAQELNNDSNAAMESYGRAIELDPRAVAARQYRAGLWAAKAQWEKAAEDLAVVMNSEPSFENALALGRLWNRANQPERATATYREAVKLDPSRLEPRMELLDLLIADRATAEAVTMADWIAEHASDRAEILGRLGQILANTDPDRAARTLSRAASLQPGEISYRIGLGAVLVKLRRMPEAVAILSDVLERSPDSYEARANLGTALFEMKNYAAAAPAFEWMVERKPDTAVAYYFLGICYDKLQMYDRALRHFERFLTLADPERNRAEIDNVRYHLPALRRLVEQGKGKARKPKG